MEALDTVFMVEVLKETMRMMSVVGEFELRRNPGLRSLAPSPSTTSKLSPIILLGP